jgi:anaerobic selenocysteine-containing dehydrogenase
MALYVFGANPAASAPNAALIAQGLQRDDLFSVVHELFLTDTAAYADIVLPATSQLEQTDLHKAYGHTLLTYNQAAIAPLGEAKSNWEVLGLMAQALGFDDPALYQTPDEVIAEVLAATAAGNPALAGITLERLQRETTVALHLPESIPFVGGRFPTASGRVELYAPGLAAQGADPLPGWKAPASEPAAADGPFDPALAMRLVSGAAHHFVSSSLANQPGLLAHEGEPFVEIHPADAAVRGIIAGQPVIMANGRGWVQLRAVITGGVRPGVVASPKGRWARLSDGRNVNWTTSDALGDLAGQSTFHSTLVWVRPAE